MRQLFFCILLIFSNCLLAQEYEVEELFNQTIGPVEFRTAYMTDENSTIFSAYNKTKAPVYIHIHFDEVSRLSFHEEQPFVRRLEKGLNDLFTLEQSRERGIPRFPYSVTVYKSNPLADVDLAFPYLIPLRPGKEARVVDITSLKAFGTAKEPENYMVTGFDISAGDAVFAARTGVVVEIVGKKRTTKPARWYNTWTNCVTILQPNGTLICYKNCDATKLKIGQKIFAGQPIGEVVNETEPLIIVIYHDVLTEKFPRFIIPQFAISAGKVEVLNSSGAYTVIHPDEVKAMEMTRRERKKYIYH